MNNSIVVFLLLICLFECKLLYAYAMIRHGALYAKKDYYHTEIPA
jgi:hypothetical protein